MGRAATNPVRRYFKVDPKDPDYLLCQCVIDLHVATTINTGKGKKNKDRDHHTNDLPSVPAALQTDNPVQKFCMARMKGDHSKNLERHVEKFHPNEFEELKVRKANTTNRKRENENQDLEQERLSLKRLRQTTLSTFKQRKSIEMTFRFCIEEVKDAKFSLIYISLTT